MKEIVNLARIVTARSVPHLPVLDLSHDNKTKEARFVTSLLELPDSTPTQLVKAVYGQMSKENLRAMQRLQSRVRVKLLNQLYFLDHSDPRHLVSRRYQLECLDLLHKVSILFAEGEYMLTEQLLRRCLRLATEGEFTQYAVQCARMLTLLYAELSQPTRYKRAAKELQHQQTLLNAENEAESLYNTTLLALAGTVKSRRTILPLLPEHVKKLEALHRRANTFDTYNYLYRLRLQYHGLLGEYGEISRLTGLADKQLREGKLNAKRFDKRFNHFARIFAHLRSRQAAKGLALAKVAIQDFHQSSSNWFFFQETHLLLALHAQQYEYAQQLLAAVKRNPTFVKQRAAAIERWDLYQAYADFVLPPSRMGPTRRMRLAQWVHMLPEFTKDKAGQNIAILVLQLLHHMRDGNFEESMVRLERLRKYQQRHMTGSGMLRSRLFLRLLRVIVDNGFNAKASAAAGKALWQTLQNTNPPGEADAEVEIIPYEHLWSIILDILREQTLAPKAHS